MALSELNILYNQCGFHLFPTWLLLEIPSPDEVEVYRAVQDCLELRKSYVFKEAVTPWEKETISDPSTPKPIQNPFDYTPEGKSDVSLLSKLMYLSHAFCSWSCLFKIIVFHFHDNHCYILSTIGVLMNHIEIYAALFSDGRWSCSCLCQQRL